MFESMIFTASFCGEKKQKLDVLHSHFHYPFWYASVTVLLPFPFHALAFPCYRFLSFSLPPFLCVLRAAGRLEEESLLSLRIKLLQGIKCNGDQILVA